ncbi:MAG TPA: hypothetical protein VFF14_00605, partial [Candidatus Deferrimicrobium sp.]|nr:hypothetical protein [Candidatus Deferrimicrobium sp.]
GELSVVRRTFGLKDKNIISGGTASQVLSPLDGGTREQGLMNNCLTQCHQTGGVLPSFANTNSSSGTSSNANGCEVCHVLSNRNQTYIGTDVTIPQNQSGHGMVHRLTTQIPYTQCNQCHNQGLHDAVNMKFTPRSDIQHVTDDWGQGKLEWKDRIKDYYLPGEVFARCEVSLDCIDCHTRQDVMGDGHQYLSEYDAVHIQCQDCHGNKEALPMTKVVNDPKDLAFDEKITNPVFPELNLGQQIVVTRKGEELPFVRHQENNWYLVSRITGKSVTIPVVKGSPCQQNVNEQNADACHKCHSTSSGAN